MAAFVRSDVVHDLTATFDAIELSNGHRVDLGGIRLSTRSTSHNVESFGLRVETDGVSFAYSGDSAPCDSLVDLAQGTEIFLCEAGAGTLVLTHLAEGLSAAEALRRAATVFPRTIEMAHPACSWTAASRQHQMTTSPERRRLSALLMPALVPAGPGW